MESPSFVYSADKKYPYHLILPRYYAENALRGELEKSKELELKYKG